MVIAAGQFSSPDTVPSQSDGNRRIPTSRGDRRIATSRTEAVDDAQLVRRFNQGDETAFTTIMSRYRDRLFAVALRVLKNRSDAEEITQDTFLCAHRGLGGFRGDSSLSTWLHRIAFNLSRNRYWYFYRRCRHASLSLDSTFSEQSPTTFSDLVTTDAVGPAREAVITEFSDLIATCMTQLDPPQREILTMRVTRQLSYAEIAHQFGISVGTVKSRIARARDRLRSLMKATCPEFDPAERQVEWFEPVRHSGGIEAIRC